MNPNTETSVADDLLRNGYERWARLEEEKAVVSADLKELFAELKAHGFDGKALRAAFRTVAKVDDLSAQEHNAVVDLYVNSLLGNRVGTENANAQARSAGEPEHDPETGEIIEPQSAPQAERDLTDSKPLGQVATIQPETDTTRIPNASGPDSAENGVSITTLDPREIAGSSNGRTAEFDSADAGSTPAPASTVTPFTPKPLRPYCLNPGNTCGGMGKKHCWKCQKAHDEEQGAA